MATNANVTSTEAIAAFRSALLVYVSKAKPVLEDACDEVARMRMWLQSSQRVHWENEVRKRTRILENAQQALFSQSIGSLRDPGMAEKMAVTKAKRALVEADEKLQAVKRWNREFDHLAAPMVKHFESLRTALANDMPKAAAQLSNIVRTLDAYANVSPGGVAGAMPASDPVAAADDTPAPATAKEESSA
jgi:hypothetical protein